MAKAESPSPSPSGEVAEGQPFLPYHPSSSSSSSTVRYGVPQYYVLLPLHRIRLRRPRRFAACCGGSCTLLTTITFLLLLSFALFFLWPSDPEVRIVRVQLDHIHVRTTPIPYLDISMGLQVQVRNPDFFSLHYDSLAASIAYRGRNLGFVTSGDGVVEARATSFVDANLKLDGIKVIEDTFYLIEDLAMGSIPFDTKTEVDGWIQVFFISVPIKGKISCSVHVNTNNQTISHQDCYPE